MNRNPVINYLAKSYYQIYGFFKRNKHFFGAFEIIEDLGYLMSYPLTFFMNKNKEPIGFIIFGSARSGSTLLVSLLSSHPQIHCEEEIFRQRRLFSKLNIMARRKFTRKDVYGCKILNYQLPKFQNIKDIRKFLLWLNKENWKIIHLKRKNVVRQAISSLHARITGRWQRYRTHQHRERVYINCKILIRIIEELERGCVVQETYLKDIPHMTVIYEDDLLPMENHQKTADRICEYLGVQSAPVKAKIFRTSADKISDFVENHEEVTQALEKAGYAEFLKDKAGHIES